MFLTTRLLSLSATTLLLAGCIGISQTSIAETGKWVRLQPATPERTMGEFRNQFAFATLKDDGSVVSWGFLGITKGNTCTVFEQLNSDVVTLASPFVQSQP